MKQAFTLAEVLITLGIIGIVAAMTLPTLIGNHQKKVTIVKLQKAYSTVGNIFQKAVAENGDIDTWDATDNETFLKTYILPNINYTKYYTENCDWSGCFCQPAPYTSFYKWPGNQGITSPFPVNGPSVITSDGMCIVIDKKPAFINIWIDINNRVNRPNKMAKDTFALKVNNNGKVEGYKGNCIDKLNSKKAGTGQGCFDRIIRDGWKIKYDWNF